MFKIFTVKWSSSKCLAWISNVSDWLRNKVKWMTISVWHLHGMITILTLPASHWGSLKSSCQTGYLVEVNHYTFQSMLHGPSNGLCYILGQIQFIKPESVDFSIRSNVWWCHMCNTVGKDCKQNLRSFKGLVILKSKMLNLWYPWNYILLEITCLKNLYVYK